MSVRSVALAAVAALCLSTAALTGTPVMAQTPAAAPTADPAKVATVEQIYSNLRITEVMCTGVTRSIMNGDGYKMYTPAERAKLVQLLTEGLTAAKPSLLHKLAIAHAGKYSMEQLTSLLDASKITYVQELLAKRIDDSLPEPDPATMTVSEKALFDSLDTQQYIGDFLTGSADFSSLFDDLSNVDDTALQKLAEWRKTQAAGT